MPEVYIPIMIGRYLDLPELLEVDLLADERSLVSFSEAAIKQTRDLPIHICNWTWIISLLLEYERIAGLIHNQIHFKTKVKGE